MTAYENFLKTGKNEWNTDFYKVEPGKQKLRFRFYDGSSEYQNVTVTVNKVYNKGRYTVISVANNGRWYYNKMEKAFKADNEVAENVAMNGEFN